MSFLRYAFYDKNLLGDKKISITLMSTCIFSLYLSSVPFAHASSTILAEDHRPLQLVASFISFRSSHMSLSSSTRVTWTMSSISNLYLLQSLVSIIFMQIFFKPYLLLVASTHTICIMLSIQAFIITCILYNCLSFFLIIPQVIYRYLSKTYPRKLNHK